jgi:hypothetical protein
MPTAAPPELHATGARRCASQGPAALARLRGDVTRRPQVDPGLGGGLREWLEDGVADAVRSRATGVPPLVVHKRSLTTALSGTEPPESHSISLPMARGALVDALFRQLVTTGALPDPMEDALAALEVDERQCDLSAFVRALPADQFAELTNDVLAHCAALAANWPTLDDRWLPRTQERIAIPLAGGRVVLTGVIDLIIGAPSTGRASVCIVELKTGVARPEHREDLHFYALLETVRSGAPPFRVATYYSRTAELDADDVNEELLGAAVQRTIDGVAELCRRGAVSG